MSLRNDFHAANAHTAAYQTLARYIAFAGQMNDSAGVRHAVEHAPQTVIKGRNFLQLVLDDTMDAFATLMARTIQDSDVTFEEVPHEFFLKLMRDRYGSKIKKDDAKEALRKVIDFKMAQSSRVVAQQSDLPTSIRIVMEDVEPPVLAALANGWTTMLRSLSTLMMSDRGLAASNAANEMATGVRMEVQEHIENVMRNQQGLGLGGPGGPGRAGGKGSFDAVLKTLETKNFPPDVKEKVEEELEKLKNEPTGTEANKTREYLKWVAALPWSEYSALEKDINKTESTLEADHYGLTKVKRAIVEHVAVENHTNGNSGRILCLVGPPGVGKTSIASSIAKATGREYQRISLGGIRDESVIRGHGRTYLGSRPGRIVHALKKAGTNNPLFVLDEIDKMGEGGPQGNPAAAMLEVLDPAQNNTFNDHFMEVDLDLSKVMFIATANELDNIPGPLRDRMDIIRIPGYTREEKMEIAKRHLIVKKMASNGLTPADIEIRSDALGYMISKYTREAGVRSLERLIDKVCRRVVVDNEKAVTKGKVTVTPADLENILGPVRIKRLDVTANGDRVGIVNGLAYSEVGGSILQLEAVMRPSRMQDARQKDFLLNVTGNLGKVMNESTEAALSAALDVVATSRTKLPEQDRYVLHINAVEGAVPKDGPSAGAAIATAIISVLTDIPIRSNVAMTGAISGNGYVLPIGGLPEKLDGALQDGADTVIIPRANLPDLEDVPASIRDKLIIKAADRIEDVLDIALARPLLGPSFGIPAAVPANLAPANDQPDPCDAQTPLPAFGPVMKLG